MVRWADARDGSVLEVLCLLKVSGRQKQKKKKIKDRHPWDVLDDSDCGGREGENSTQEEDSAEDSEKKERKKSS